MTLNRLVVGIAATFAFAAQASGTYTWSGGGINAYWDTPQNWSTGVVPPQLSDVVIGTGFGSGSSILITQVEVTHSLRLKNAPNGFRISHGFGGPYTLALWPATLVRESTCVGDQQIFEPIELTAQGTWTVSGLGRLLIENTITSQPNIGLVKDGDGELRLNSTGSWSGTTKVNNGLLTVATANGLPATKLYVSGLNSRAHFTTSLSPLLTLIQLSNGGKLTAGTNASLSASFTLLFDTSELAARLTGTGVTIIADGANAVISSGQSNTGSTTLNTNATLNATYGAGALGPATNELVMNDGSRVILPSNTTLVATRTVTTSGTGVTIQGAHQIDAVLQGPAALTLATTAVGATVTLGGANSNFTGRFVRPTGHLSVGHGALGKATEVRLDETGRTLTFSDDHVSFGTTRPAIKLGSGGTFDLANHNAVVGPVSAVGTVPYNIVLAPSGSPDPRTLIVATLGVGTTCPPDTTRVVIKGWAGAAGNPGLFHRVFLDGVLSPTNALDCVQFEGFTRGAQMIADFEIVPRP